MMEEQLVNQWRKSLHSYTLNSLRDAYQKLIGEMRDDTRDKLLAEVCYLISTEELARQNFREAIASAEESIRLYEGLDIKTLEQAAPILFRHLPDAMHQTVVKERVLDKIPSSAPK